MQTHTLGNSKLRVSEIGFGCMSLKLGDADNENILHNALNAGINFFDTADLYDKGENEALLGRVFKDRRDQVIIATKVGNQWRSDGSGWDWNPRKEYILEAVEGSLRRLRTDYIDLYQLHGGTINDPIEETIEAFEILKQQGKIRAYGISSIRPNVIREYVQRSRVASVMMQYSVLDRRPEETAFPLLKKHNIGVLTRGSVAQGLLIDKPAKQYLNYDAADVERAANAVRHLTIPHRNAAQTALRFALQQPAVTSVIAGIRTMEQLKEAVLATSAPPLVLEEMLFLKAAIAINRYQEHR